jgi:two-component system, NarL family, nitrate/nitrite response regulator NarL
MNRRAPALVGNDPFCDLTRRQLQIVKLLKTGASNKEIARALNISDGTVKVHLHAIFEKLGVTNRAKLIAYSFTAR